MIVVDKLSFMISDVPNPVGDTDILPGPVELLVTLATVHDVCLPVCKTSSCNICITCRIYLYLKNICSSILLIHTLEHIPGGHNKSHPHRSENGWLNPLVPTKP